MKKAFTVIAFIFVSTGLVSAQEAPVAISPGNEMGIAKIGTSCPTFSWTAVEGAASYRVEIFEAFGEVRPKYFMTAQNFSPILVKEIQGAATSWTPSSDQGLLLDRDYVWFVQALDTYGNGAWSEGKMFRVEAGPGFTAIEEKLGGALEEHGVNEEIIGDVLDQLKSEIVKNEGILTAGSDYAAPIKVQGNETGSNTYYGESAGFSLTTGTENSLFGYQSGYSITSAIRNVFIGAKSGYLTTSSGNTFIGAYAGVDNTTGNLNTFVGNRAAENNTTGYGNTMVGNCSGAELTTGYHNTTLGYNAGRYNETGDRNTFVGGFAGSNSAGNDNVFLGYLAGSSESGNGKLYIDSSATSAPLIWGDFAANRLAINGRFGINTHSPAYPMEMKATSYNASIVVNRTDGAMNFINATDEFGNFGTVNDFPLRLVQNAAWKMRLDADKSLTMRNGATCTAGGVWTNASSRDLKENIHDIPLEQALKAFNELQPVAYCYKADKEDEHLGFIAEDVPDLVASKDRKGMSPMDIVAVLTKVVQEQQRTINALKAEMEKFKKK